MTQEEILREAARIQAARRRRVERTCDHCGATYEGLVHSRYCSDRCRVAASRQRRTAAAPSKSWNEKDLPPARREDESLDEHRARVREWTRQQWAPNAVPPEVERRMAIVERLARFQESQRGHDLGEDSTEILRREREARSEYLANL